MEATLLAYQMLGWDFALGRSPRIMKWIADNYFGCGAGENLRLFIRKIYWLLPMKFASCMGDRGVDSGPGMFTVAGWAG